MHEGQPGAEWRPARQNRMMHRFIRPFGGCAPTSRSQPNTRRRCSRSNRPSDTTEWSATTAPPVTSVGHNGRAWQTERLRPTVSASTSHTMSARWQRRPGPGPHRRGSPHRRACPPNPPDHPQATRRPPATLQRVIVSAGCRRRPRRLVRPRPRSASGRAAFCPTRRRASAQVSGRDYAHRVGGSRFLETDPVEGGSANDYDYVEGDPVNNHDLAGTYCLTGKNKNGSCRSLSRGAGRADRASYRGVIRIPQWAADTGHRTRDRFTLSGCFYVCLIRSGSGKTTLGLSIGRGESPLRKGVGWSYLYQHRGSHGAAVCAGLCLGWGGGRPVVGIGSYGFGLW
jgi:hypothetical protein